MLEKRLSALEVLKNMRQPKRANIEYDKIDRVRGMDITIVTSASDDMGGRALLRALGFPFREEAS